MKTTILSKLVMMAGIILLGLTSCNHKEDNGITSYLGVITEELHASGSGDNLVVSIKSNRQVDVLSDSEWCKVTLDHNPSNSDVGSLMISVDPTDAKVERTATITLSAEGCKS